LSAVFKGHLGGCGGANENSCGEEKGLNAIHAIGSEGCSQGIELWGMSSFMLFLRSMK
jgi:hypothetical protein